MIEVKTLFIVCALWSGLQGANQESAEVKANRDAVNAWYREISVSAVVRERKSAWIANMMSNHFMPGNADGARLENLLLSTPPDKTLLEMVAKEESAETNIIEFNAKREEVEKRIKEWRTTLDTLTSDYTRQWLKEKRGRVLPVSVWIRHNQRNVRALEFNPQVVKGGLEFASAGEDKWIGVYNLNFTGEKSLNQIASFHRESVVKVLKYGKDGSWFITREADNTVSRWMFKADEQGHHQSVHPPAQIVSPMPATKQSLSAICLGKGADMYYGYDLKSMAKASVFSGEAETKILAPDASSANTLVYKICLNDRAETIAIVSAKKVYFISLANNTLPVTLTDANSSDLPVEMAEAEAHGVNSMVALEDNQFAYALYNDKRVALCSSNNLSELLRNPIDKEIVSLVYDATRHLLIGGEYNPTEGAGGRMVIWDMHNDPPTPVVMPGIGTLAGAGHGGTVWSLAISPDFRWLLSGGSKGEICLWDMEEIERYTKANEEPKTAPPANPSSKPKTKP